MVEPKRLYFGYGSNMWKEQMRNRCKDSKFVGVGVYPGWKWIINITGYANIIPSPGDEVYGLLYEMTPEDEKALDGYEGYPENYQKEMADIKVVRADERENTVVAFVYIDERRKTEGEIKAEYIIRMNYAIADALEEGVPNLYIQHYLRRFVPVPPELQ